MINRSVAFFLILLLNFSLSYADEVVRELQVKRKNVFEFTKEPTITKTGDSVSIEFSVKDFCDVTVAIQNLEGNIVRHLASGVLGENAPVPFKQNSLDQKIIWDSKDDKGKYCDELNNLNIRVSLGLKPMYEKDIYHSPYIRISGMPVIATGPEGVYVFEGVGRDQLRLFSHKGEYVKTVYPFPASQIEKVKGLDWYSYGNREKIPLKYSLYHQTLLSSGDNGPTATGYSVGYTGMTGKGASTVCVQGNRLVLALENINRLQTDGSTGGVNIKGPSIGIPRKSGGYGGVGAGTIVMGPSSSAFSPDGKTVYFTGFLWHFGYGSLGASGNIPVVMKYKYDAEEPAAVFAGKNKQEDYGNAPDQFNTPSSVDTDKNGNVYVSDFCNDRVQIFDSEGKLLQSLIVTKPARVLIHKVSGEVYVFSYPIIGVPPEVQKKLNYDFNKVEKTLTTFSAFPELKKVSSEEFPIGGTNHIELAAQGNTAQIALDSWSKTPTIWIAAKKYVANETEVAWGGRHSGPQKDWMNGAIRRLEKVDGKWVEVDNFGKRVEKELVRPKPPAWNIQHLFVNPKTRKLYIGEADSGPTCKAFTELLEVDTDSGATKIIKLPFNPMDIAFDLDGLIYMRTMSVLGRYNMETWKEVPFDYGSELQKVGEDGGIGGSSTSLVSGLLLPATNAVCYHQGGLDVNANGDILVACHNSATMIKNAISGTQVPLVAYNEYKPLVYPGRFSDSKSTCLHVWDKQGKVKFQDIVSGCPQTDGVFLDINNNVYMMAVPARQINNKELDDGMSSTLIKFKTQKGKFLSMGGEVPLPAEQAPKRSKELYGLWVENYEWIYGGVGLGGFNAKTNGGGCACWFARFKLDYFARSFAPEPMQYSVAVLDSNGNLITRIGRYGNVDSAGPKSKEPLGGDEVGLFHPCFVGALTDKKIFISDIGNERIVSVKLGYNTEKILPIIK
jgi:hypothetical protein